MDDPYAVAPINLENREIRLIMLEPSSDDPEHIKCSLLPHALSENSLRYDALSCTWDSSGYTCQIELNGVVWPVGRNFWA
jgi:hypothetical protein